MKYFEQLKDPRWQRKRLEIMQRDEFACSCCASETKTLNVHHTYYERNVLLWDYPSGSLVTLCEDCHLRTEQSLRQLRLALADIDPTLVSGFALDFAHLKTDKNEAFRVLCWLLRNRDLRNNIYQQLIEAEKQALASAMQKRGMVAIL